MALVTIDPPAPTSTSEDGESPASRILAHESNFRSMVSVEGMAVVYPGPVEETPIVKPSVIPHDVSVPSKSFVGSKAGELAWRHFRMRPAPGVHRP